MAFTTSASPAGDVKLSTICRLLNASALQCDFRKPLWSMQALYATIMPPLPDEQQALQRIPAFAALLDKDASSSEKDGQAVEKLVVIDKASCTAAVQGKAVAAYVEDPCTGVPVPCGVYHHAALSVQLPPAAFGSHLPDRERRLDSERSSNPKAVIAKAAMKLAPNVRRCIAALAIALQSCHFLFP